MGGFTMKLTDYISLGVGFFAPLLVSAFKDYKWKTTIKLIVVALVALLIAAATVYLTDSFNTEELRDSFTLVLSVMLISYKALWENTQINKTLTKWAPFSTKLFKKKPIKRKRRTVSGGSVNSDDNSTIAPGPQDGI